MSRGYLLLLSHSSFPLANTSFSPTPHPYPERRSSRVVDSNGGKLVRWRKTRETTAGSCDRDMQSDYGTKGLCGRARTAHVVEQEERKKEDTEHAGPTITCT
jgi:hypothetical protein